MFSSVLFWFRSAFGCLGVHGKRGLLGKPSDNPCRRCFRISGSRLGLPAFPQPHPTAALSRLPSGPAIVRFHFGKTTPAAPLLGSTVFEFHFCIPSIFVKKRYRTLVRTQANWKMTSCLMKLKLSAARRPARWRKQKLAKGGKIRSRCRKSSAGERGPNLLATATGRRTELRRISRRLDSAPTRNLNY